MVLSVLDSNYIILELLIQMRRRSGAIHSQSQQEFILLAEKSLHKTGIFYDQRLYNQVQKAQQTDSKSKGDSDKKQNPFAEFDFNQVKQYEKDERDLNIEMNKKSQINMKYVVICDEVLPVVRLLNSQLQGKSDVREVDLIVRKPKNNKATSVTLKYWVICSTIIDSPLAKSNDVITLQYTSNPLQKYIGYHLLHAAQMARQMSGVRIFQHQQRKSRKNSTSCEREQLYLRNTIQQAKY